VDPDGLRASEGLGTDGVAAGAEEALASRDRQRAPERALYEGISEGGTLLSLERRPI